MPWRTSLADLVASPRFPGSLLAVLARDLAKSNDTAPGVAGIARDPPTELMAVLAVVCDRISSSGSFTWNELCDTGLTLDVGHGVQQEKHRHQRRQLAPHASFAFRKSTTKLHIAFLPVHSKYVL